MKRKITANLHKLALLLMSGIISIRDFVVDCFTTQSESSYWEGNDLNSEQPDSLEQITLLQWHSVWSEVTTSVLASLKYLPSKRNKFHFNKVNQYINTKLNAFWRHQLDYGFVSSLNHHIRVCRHLSGEADHYCATIFHLPEKHNPILRLCFFLLYQTPKIKE